MESNAVVREILKIGSQWQQLKKDHPSTILFCWKGSRLELEYVNAFIQYQLSDQSLGADTFLIFDNAFEDIFTHGLPILKEFEKGIQAWHDGLTDDQKKQKDKWKLIGDSHQLTSVEFFANNINSLPAYYELKSHEKLVIVLSPKSISNSEHYAEWINDLVAQQINSSVKLMINDQEQFPYLKSATKNRSIISVTPSIDAFGGMEAAQKETMPSKEDPNALFQTYLLNASKFFGKQKIEKALKETQRCINIGKRHDLFDPLASVHIFRATIYASIKEDEKVFKEMDMAIEMAQNNNQLMIQAMLMKGSYALRFNQKQLAYECFQDPTSLARELKEDFLLIEALRLKGASAEMMGRNSEAWDGYLEAYETFQTMEERKGNASTFKLLALNMLSLCSQFGYDQRRFMKDTEERFGRHWWGDMRKPKKKKLEEVILETNDRNNGESATV